MQTYTRQLVRVQNWLKQRPEIPVLAVNCAQACADPAGTAARLAQFLGEPFDSGKAVQAVDPSLRRRRRGST
jgi:hypothetical protein